MGVEKHVQTFDHVLYVGECQHVEELISTVVKNRLRG